MDIKKTCKKTPFPAKVDVKYGYKTEKLTYNMDIIAVAYKSEPENAEKKATKTTALPYDLDIRTPRCRMKWTRINEDAV